MSILGKGFFLFAAALTGAAAAWAVSGIVTYGAILAVAVAALVLLSRLPARYPIPTGTGVVITGASSGIGRDAAIGMAKQGFTVFAGVRKKEDFPPLQEHGCHPVLLDVSKQQSVMNAVKEVQAALKAADNHLCAIVNNAGVSPSFLPLELESPDSVAFQMGVNTMGVLTTTQHFLPLLRAMPGGGGRIVTVGSVFGLVSMGDTGVYCMSKHAVEAFTGALRAEVAPWKIAVSVLNPGFVRTELANKREEQEADALAKLRAQFPEDMQQVYPSVFSEQLRTAQMAEAKKQFGASPTAAQTTTPAILHAITSSRPEPSYKLSSLTPSGGFPTVEVFIWFYSFLSDAVKARIFTAYYNGGKKVINNSKTD